MMETPEGRKDFNERTGRMNYWQEKGHELEFLLGKNGLIEGRYVQYRGACPCCGTKPPGERQLWMKEGLRYVRCADCGMVFIDPILKPDILDDIYESAQSSRAWIQVLINQEGHDVVKYLEIIKSFEPHLYFKEKKDSLKFLDVGASYGLFLHILADRYPGAWRYGLELCKEALEVGAKRFPDVELRNEKLESWAVGREESVDVVTFLEVLEHIPDPNEILECARSVLVPDGLLVVLVPNLEAKTNVVLHEKSKTFGANHLNYWSVTTLSQQLMRAGFHWLNCKTLIGDVNTWWNHLHYEDPYAGNLVHPDHAEATRQTIADGQGYKLLAVARKQ